MGRASSRLVIAALVVAVGFGGYWVGRSIIHEGNNNFKGAAEIPQAKASPQAAASARAARRRRNLQILGGLAAAGAIFVVVPGIIAFPRRRRRAHSLG
jgi:hypothetical protein